MAALTPSWKHLASWAGGSFALDVDGGAVTLQQLARHCRALLLERFDHTAGGAPERPKAQSVKAERQTIWEGRHPQGPTPHRPADQRAKKFSRQLGATGRSTITGQNRQPFPYILPPLDRPSHHLCGCQSMCLLPDGPGDLAAQGRRTWKGLK